MVKSWKHLCIRFLNEMYDIIPGKMTAGLESISFCQRTEEQGKGGGADVFRAGVARRQ